MIYLISFILSIASVLFLLNISFKDTVLTFLSKMKTKSKPIKKTIRQHKGKNNKHSLSDIEYELRDFLKRTGKEALFDFVLVLSIGLSLFSVPLSLILNNIFLLPFFSILLFSLPYVALLLWKNSYEKKEYSELETAMSLVTSSLVRNQDIVDAFRENIEFIRSPVKSKFEDFVLRISSIDPDVKSAIRELKKQFPYKVFAEWCTELEMANDDRSKTDMLPRTVSKMTDERIVNLEIAPLLSNARKEFFTMAIMVLLNFPLLKILNDNWFKVLTDTWPGKLVTGLVLLSILISTFFCFKLTKRITSYKGGSQ